MEFRAQEQNFRVAGQEQSRADLLLFCIGIFSSGFFFSFLFHFTIFQFRLEGSIIMITTTLDQTKPYETYDYQINFTENAKANHMQHHHPYFIPSDPHPQHQHLRQDRLCYCFFLAQRKTNILATYDMTTTTSFVISS